MFIPKPGHVEFEMPPSGTFVARCYRFLDLGTQPKTYQGVTSMRHIVRISWEMPTEPMEKGQNAGKPFSIHNTYTWSMSDKSLLRKTLESWRGKKFVDSDFGEGGFNTKNLIGVPCMIGISHNESKGKVYANLTSVSPLLKGYEMPPQVNPSLYFSFDEAKKLDGDAKNAYIDSFMNAVSQSTRDMIVSCPEYSELFGYGKPKEEPLNDPMPEYDDRVPF